MIATARLISVRLREHLRPAAGSPQLRPLILLRVEAADGLAGHGEAAPLEAYDGVSIARTMAALERYRAVLAGLPAPTDAVELAQALTACRAADPLPQALAAVDLALWDLIGRRAGLSVHELLGVHDPPPLALNATVGAVAPAQAAAEAAAACQAGFAALKVKVGTPDDRQRLMAVRAAVGADTLIRADANGAWDRLTAPERVRALARFGIELFEEPVHGLAAAQALTSAVPEVAISLDESAPAALEAGGTPVCAALCLKISASGGISGLISDAARARQLRYEIYIASTLDGPLGIAAALHAAAAVGPQRPCGLATLGRFDRAVPGPLQPARGQLALPDGPGLGDRLLDWYLE
jgi:L-alanine-DL-glutamate epimerase-like enolase superfamily enzyme